MNKTKLNYWIDLVIALAFILSAISGIVFLFPFSGSTALGITYILWNDIHTWSSLLMIVGVFAHLVLHWKWIVAMTKKTFFSSAKPTRTAAAANGTAISRRHFLRTAGLGALALSTAAISYKTLFGSEDTDNPASTSASEVLPAATIAPLATVTTQDSLPTPEVKVITDEAAVQPTAVQQTVAEPTATSIPVTVVPAQSAATQMTVACHKGVTYDAYPGKCRHYIDADGDGFCDLSIPSST